MSLDCDIEIIKFTLDETRKKLNEQVLINKKKDKKIFEYEEKINNLWNEFKQQKCEYETKINNLQKLLEVQNIVD
tara:strand:- start:1350 stop:1574 length:225 start_codon:yes stop_codon:yes gene_type:complete